MVAFRIGDVRIESLDRASFLIVLERAESAGGRTSFPILYALGEGEPEVDPDAFIDELRRLARAAGGSDAAALVGALRDDLLQALTLADEG